MYIVKTQAVKPTFALGDKVYLLKSAENFIKCMYDMFILGVGRRLNKKGHLIFK